MPHPVTLTKYRNKQFSLDYGYSRLSNVVKRHALNVGLTALKDLGVVKRATSTKPRTYVGRSLMKKFGPKKALKLAQSWRATQSNKIRYNPTSYKGVATKYKGRRSGFKSATVSRVFNKKNTASMKRIYPHRVSNTYYYNRNPVILTTDTTGDGSPDTQFYNSSDIQPNGTLMKIRMESVQNFGDSSFMYRDISLPQENSGFGLATFNYSYPYETTSGGTTFPAYSSIQNMGVCSLASKASLYKPLQTSSVVSSTDSGSFFDYLLESVVHNLTIINNSAYKCLFNVMLVKEKVNTETGGTSLLQPMSRERLGTLTNMFATADKRQWHTLSSKSVVLPPVSNEKRYPKQIKLTNWLGYNMTSSRPVYEKDYTPTDIPFGSQVSKSYGQPQNDKLNNRTFLVFSVKSLNQRPVQKLSNIPVAEGSQLTQSIPGTQLFYVQPTDPSYNASILQRSNVNIEIKGSTKVNFRLRNAITNSLQVGDLAPQAILDAWQNLASNNLGFPDKDTAWSGPDADEVSDLNYYSNPIPHQDHPDDKDFGL